MTAEGLPWLDVVRDFVERHGSWGAAARAYDRELHELDREIASLGSSSLAELLPQRLDDLQSRRQALAAAESLFADPSTLDLDELRWVAEVSRRLDHGDEPPNSSPEARERKSPSQRTNAYTYGTLQKAVKLVAAQASLNDVAGDANLRSTHDARRVRRMYETGLLSLNPQGKLWVDRRVRRSGRQILLRYWDEDGISRDPRDHPQ